MKLSKLLWEIVAGFNLMYLTIGVIALNHNEPYDINVIWINLTGFVVSVFLSNTDD